MAKEKRSKVVSNVYKEGVKYHCAECHQELPVKKACPVCKKEIDWDRVLLETRDQFR
jgi:hypothetical protein